MHVLFLILAYVVGSCPTAYLVGKWVKGIDIREHGSKNVGATNAFRCVGKGWGTVVLLFDILKGFAVVTLVPITAGKWGVSTSEPFIFLCGVVAILGHNWTVFLRFKGGKGVATTLGVFLGLFPLPLCLALVVSVALIVLTGYVSLGSLVGAVTFPLFFFWMDRGREHFGFFMGMILCLSVMILLKHRKNMERLLQGTENRIGKRDGKG